MRFFARTTSKTLRTFKMGRRRLTYSSDPEQDELLRKPHNTWEITEWNLSDENLAWYKRLQVSAIILSEEICPKTGSPHWQGQVVFRRKYRFAALKKIFPSTCHLEVSKAPQDNNYCRKADSRPVLDIDTRHQGARVVFKDQAKLIREGAPASDLIELEGANWQSLRTAEMLFKYLEPQRPAAPREVVEVSDSLEAYRKWPKAYVLSSLQYWDGYDAHDTVYINCRKLGATRRQVESWIDGGPYLVPTKGGFRQARYGRVVISQMPAVRPVLGRPEPLSAFS